MRRGKKMTQKQEILVHLKKHGEITPLDALKEFGCFRLAARIHELRKAGYKITNKTEKNILGKTITSYVLSEEGGD
jgi:predicted ArsR family transcriptional regulator